MYVEARTQVRSVGATGWMSVKIGLHQGSTLSSHFFGLIMGVLAFGLLFTDKLIVLCSTNRDEVEPKVKN